jgi:hypothetical protein
MVVLHFPDFIAVYYPIWYIGNYIIYALLKGQEAIIYVCRRKQAICHQTIYI